MENNILNLVSVENGQPVTTSLVVAEKFEREHKHVLDSISTLLEQMNTAEFSALFFESTYKASNGKTNKMYLMNRDGFSLLVMGFSGKRALKFKLKFIEAFNKMEQQLKYGVEKTPQTYLEALKELVKKEEARLDAERRARENLDAKLLQDQATSIGKKYKHKLSRASKCLNVKGFGRNKLFSFLRENNVLFYDDEGYNEVYQKYINEGKFFQKLDDTYEYPVIYITVKGMKDVLQKLINEGYEPLMNAEEWDMCCRQMQDEEE